MRARTIPKQVRLVFAPQLVFATQRLTVLNAAFQPPSLPISLCHCGQKKLQNLWLEQIKISYPSKASALRFELADFALAFFAAFPLAFGLEDFFPASSVLSAFGFLICLGNHGPKYTCFQHLGTTIDLSS